MSAVEVFELAEDLVKKGMGVLVFRGRVGGGILGLGDLRFVVEVDEGFAAGDFMITGGFVTDFGRGLVWRSIGSRV